MVGEAKTLTRRTKSAASADDLRFAIRVKFIVPDRGLGSDLDHLNAWLREHVGKERYAVRSATCKGGSAVAVHLVEPMDAVTLADSFPQLVLANIR